MLLQDRIRRLDEARYQPPAQPTGEFSPGLPANDPVSLELESLFPPFTRASA